MTTNQVNGPAKAAILVLADPDGSEDSLGRIVNALGAAHELRENGTEVDIIFSGAGTRWIAALNEEDNPAHGLYQAVKDRVAGASAFCANAFGADKDVANHDCATLGGNHVTGESGLPALLAYVQEGAPVLTF